MAQDHTFDSFKNDKHCPKCRVIIRDDKRDIWECNYCGAIMCHNCAASYGWKCPNCLANYARLNPRR